MKTIKQVELPDFKRAGNAKAWAIGRQWANGFHVRRIVWGRAMARAERVEDEVIRRALVLIVKPHG